MNSQPNREIRTLGAPAPAPAPAASVRTVDLSQETPGKAVPIAPGVWLCATRHRPGLSKHMFEVNNRCFVFRLEDRGTPCLVVINAVDPCAIPEVRRLERETGAPVRYIVSPGGGHHLLIPPWHDEFTGARVLVGPVRIPRIPHGRKVMQLPRVSTMDLADPLPQFRGQLDAILFQGLVGPPDHQSPGEGAPDTRLGLVARMFKFMTSKKNDPVDELWLYHRATQTVIAGENLAWYYPSAALKKASFMLRSMLKPDQVYIWTDARRVGDPAAVAASWRTILSWPARTLMTFHDVPGTAFTGDANAALAAAVEKAGQLR